VNKDTPFFIRTSKIQPHSGIVLIFYCLKQKRLIVFKAKIWSVYKKKAC